MNEGQDPVFAASNKEKRSGTMKMVSHEATKFVSLWLNTRSSVKDAVASNVLRGFCGEQTDEYKMNHEQSVAMGIQQEKLLCMNGARIEVGQENKETTCLSGSTSRKNESPNRQTNRQLRVSSMAQHEC